eukprot:364178-Chlamydomonas_euryale.AAC.4
MQYAYMHVGGRAGVHTGGCAGVHVDGRAGVHVGVRGPERFPSCETEAGLSVHKTCAKAAGRGLSCLPRPRPA